MQVWLLRTIQMYSESILTQIINITGSIEKVQPVHMPLNICGSKYRATSEKNRVPTPDLKDEGDDLSLFMLCTCYPSCLIQNGHRTFKHYTMRCPTNQQR
jgi:hypothetical protein